MQILKKFQNYHFVDVNKLPQPAETSVFYSFFESIIRRPVLSPPTCFNTPILCNFDVLSAIVDRFKPNKSESSVNAILEFPF